jgi:hypothetical protein
MLPCVETAPGPATLQPELDWCLQSGRLLIRCGTWTVDAVVDAEGRIAFTLHWSPRGDTERVFVANRTFPPTWARYERGFIAHLAAELLARAIELRYEG